VTESPSAEYAVIVVTYQRPRALARTLEALLRQSVGREAMEICVVNNGGAESLAHEWAARIDCWIDLEDNLGPSGGRNVGAERTRAPVLVFVDDDGVPDERFVESLGDVLRRHPDAVAARGRVVALEHPILTTMAGHYDRGADEREDLLTLEGATAIRRRAWERAGGYDLSFRTHEGLELSMRLLDTTDDAKILYTPDAVLAHDFFKGWRHLNEKARVMATGKSRVDTEEDPRLVEVIERAKTYKVADSRPWWVKATGRALGYVFKWAIIAHRVDDRIRGG
jgi:GT2 family glycosyltransferase